MGGFTRALPLTHALCLFLLGPVRLFSFIHPLPKVSSVPKMSRSVSLSLEEGAGRIKTGGGTAGVWGDLPHVARSRSGAGVLGRTGARLSLGWGGRAAVPRLTTKAASRGEGPPEESGGRPHMNLTEQLLHGAHSKLYIWSSNNLGGGATSIPLKRWGNRKIRRRAPTQGHNSSRLCSDPWIHVVLSSLLPSTY